MQTPEPKSSLALEQKTLSFRLTGQQQISYGPIEQMLKSAFYKSVSADPDLTDLVAQALKKRLAESVVLGVDPALLAQEIRLTRGELKKMGHEALDVLEQSRATILAGLVSGIRYKPYDQLAADMESVQLVFVETEGNFSPAQTTALYGALMKRGEADLRQMANADGVSKAQDEAIETIKALMVKAGLKPHDAAMAAISLASTASRANLAIMPLADIHL
jgi:hypothetical protein